MRELILYCDESDISGRHFSNFYGGAAVESKDLQEVITRLEEKKESLNLNAELKWQKITENYATKYMEFVDEIFLLLGEGKLKLRVMFTQNYFGAAKLTRAQRDNTFFLLYYQFIKHAFGFAYAGSEEETTPVRIYFDKLPDNLEKCTAFKGYVLGLNQNKVFREAKIKIKDDQLAEVDSKQHVIMQALDIVMGSIQFRLNDKHLDKPEGAHRRGKRTIAKERVYKHINAHIRKLYPGFNIGISTGRKNDNANLWRHPYRHWLFIPADFEIRPEFAKQK